MEEIEYESIVQWYCQKKYYKDMLSHAKKASEAFSLSKRLKVYFALACALNKHNNEALKVCSTLGSHETTDVALAVLLIQSYVYKYQGTTDRMAMAQLDAKIREDRNKSTALALSIAAMVALLFENYDRANDFSERSYNLDPDDENVLLARGWCLLASKDPSQKPGNFFEVVLKENNKHFNALLGSAKCRELRGDHSGSMLILNQLIVRYPKIAIPLVEKMNNLLAMKEWDQVLETSGRILSLEGNNLDAFRVRAIVVICRDGDYSESVKHVQTFFRNLVVAEPKNIDLFVDNVQLITGIAVKNQTILSELFKIVDKVSQQNPGNALLTVELGNVCLGLSKAKDAEHWYRATVRLDESSYAGLIGLARCQLRDLDPKTLPSDDLTRQQLDYIADLPEAVKSSELKLLYAKMYRAKGSRALEFLEEAASFAFESVDGWCYGSDYLKRLRPDLCLDIVDEYLIHLPSSSSGLTEGSVNENRATCAKLLEMVVEACPGLSTALLTIGRVKMQMGDFEGASAALKRLLDSVDRTNAAGHLLMARILVMQGHYESASQTLEVGLSYNFKVRDDPLYHMIVGTVAKENGDLEAAIKNLEQALAISRVKDHPSSTRLSTADQATLYLELISAYAALRRFAEASQMVEEARGKLASGPEYARIVVGHAELCVKMDDVERAIDMLNGIQPGEGYYLQAHTKLAEIYLKERKDRNSFAKCFRDLVANCPGPETNAMLGDAYLSIQEPERAIEAYELSLQHRPRDRIIARKMGQALVKTHQYAKAIAYYKEAVSKDDCQDLKLDMAQLLMKLKQFDEAEAALLEDLNEARGSNDILALEIRGKQLLLLAQVRERSGNIKGALSTLKEAKENQVRYVQRASLLPNLLDQKNVLADICFTMAEHMYSMRDYAQAVEHYKEALTYKPNDVKALLSLAKLYMQMNELEKCTQYCKMLLNADSNNEAACVMMADLAFRKVDFDTAAFHFKQLLLQKPTYWTALARLIEVSRRTGNVDDLDEWLHRAKQSMRSGKIEAGYYYCAGLLDWRTNRLSSALKNFNAARRDLEWGQQAIYNMIEICLDPDDDSNALSSELFIDEEMSSEDARGMALSTAQRLLQDLNPKGNPQEQLTHRLLSNFYLLATKQKVNVELALQDCTELANHESLRDHVGPALGLATAHILLKQQPRARNHLKRVSKNTWTFEDAEYLEKCWTLLAEIYTQSSKYDLASELLRRVIQHNATCVRAHEISGIIAEKEQNYKEAAKSYDLAWRYGGRQKLTIGYKLAYCNFKSKRFADAIEICNQVLKANPDYPRIKKDILEKSINNLRT
ncbi:tetratricopeptide repeat protein 21B-like [Trichogramma pretiosum]|uniref:tetratricopeptide repeat protein 21B-like n=1 Tax=Trichogramma pretiosum TaxID=7493 RepID=UPI0006C9E211|nr:tetratricopeptide repeat protein 21B-like [Trichogramma pretiosum]